MKMKTARLKRMHLSIRIGGLLLSAWIFCIATGLNAATINFKSGATFNGEVLSFKGTDSVVMKSSKDGKAYTILISDLTDSSQRLLESQKGTMAKAKPWMDDPGWQSCEKAIAPLREQHARLAKQVEALHRMISTKTATKENHQSEDKQVQNLNREISTINGQISKTVAAQRRIEAGYQLREVSGKP
jgi:hypothetical protein